MVIVKSGRRICGTGAALGNAPIVQNKAYFEVKIQSTGKAYFYFYWTQHGDLTYIIKGENGLKVYEKTQREFYEKRFSNRGGGLQK